MARKLIDEIPPNAYPKPQTIGGVILGGEIIGWPQFFIGWNEGVQVFKSNIRLQSFNHEM
jgi:hypothetical protein